jgi:hypothetical protein
MKPIAAPIVGGMITSTINVLILVPSPARCGRASSRLQKKQMRDNTFPEKRFRPTQRNLEHAGWHYR